MSMVAADPALARDSLPFKAEDPPRKPRVWTALLAVPVAFLIGGFATAPVIVFSLVSRLAQKGAVVPEDVAREAKALVLSTELLAATTFAYGWALIVTCLVLARASPHWASDRLRLEKAPRIGDVALAATTAIALSLAFGFACRFLPADGDGALVRLTRAIASGTTNQRLVAAIALGPVAALGEELLFRGYVQSRLEARWGTARAVVVTAILFAAVHFDRLHSTYALLAGLLYGAIAAQRRSTWPSIFAHAAANTVATLSVELPAPVRFWLGLSAVPVVFLGTFLLARTRRSGRAGVGVDAARRAPAGVETRADDHRVEAAADGARL